MNFFVKNEAQRNPMLRPYEPLLMTLLRVIDSFMGASLFVGLTILLSSEFPFIKESFILISLISLVLLHMAGLYSSWRFSSFQYEISQIFSGCILVYIFMILAAFFFNAINIFSIKMVLAWFICWPLLMSAERIAIRKILRLFRTRGYNIRTAVVAGAGEKGDKVVNQIKRNLWAGVKIIGFFDDHEKKSAGGFPNLGKLDELVNYVKQKNIDIVYIALPMHAESRIKDLMKDLADTTASIHIIPNMFFLDMVLGGKVIYFDNFPVIALRESPMRGINLLFKRLLDILLSSLILLIISPLLIFIPIAIKLTSKGPVFYRQNRYGFNGKKIVIYKFRTMTVCDDDDAFIQAKKNDDRITGIGHFLRRTSLDELPQFFNVLQGRMSIVGPRPHPVALNEEFRSLVPGYMLRHKVVPGITGLAQIKGYRGETDTLEKMQKRVEYDLKYLREWSILLDLEIILKTVLNRNWMNNAY